MFEDFTRADVKSPICQPQRDGIKFFEWENAKDLKKPLGPAVFERFPMCLGISDMIQMGTDFWGMRHRAQGVLPKVWSKFSGGFQLVLSQQKFVELFDPARYASMSSEQARTF